MNIVWEERTTECPCAPPRHDAVEDAAVKDDEAVGRGRDEPAARCERRVRHPLLRDQRRPAHALREAAVISQQSYLSIYMVTTPSSADTLGVA